MLPLFYCARLGHAVSTARMCNSLGCRQSSTEEVANSFEEPSATAPLVGQPALDNVESCSYKLPLLRLSCAKDPEQMIPPATVSNITTWVCQGDMHVCEQAAAAELVETQAQVFASS